MSLALPAAAQDKVRLLLDWFVNPDHAALVIAKQRGLFAKQGLAVTPNFVNGSLDAIAKVASGDSEMALVDINELIRWRDKPGAPPIKAVFMLYNQSPYSFVARKSRGIRSLSDIAGKTVGVADSDFSFKLWPALAKLNGIKADSLKTYKMSASVREPILSAGQVDAVAGFSYLAAVNLRDRGVPAGDLTVLRYNDYGCETYGFAVIVSPLPCRLEPAEAGDGPNTVSENAAASAIAVARWIDGNAASRENIDWSSMTIGRRRPPVSPLIHVVFPAWEYNLEAPVSANSIRSWTVHLGWARIPLPAQSCGSGVKQLTSGMR
jgi:ABC-type amino acid transport substrate-binding protein